MTLELADQLICDGSHLEPWKPRDECRTEGSLDEWPWSNPQQNFGAGRPYLDSENVGIRATRKPLPPPRWNPKIRLVFKLFIKAPGNTCTEGPAQSTVRHRRRIFKIKFARPTPCRSDPARQQQDPEAPSPDKNPPRHGRFETM